MWTILTTSGNKESVKSKFPSSAFKLTVHPNIQPSTTQTFSEFDLLEFTCISIGLQGDTLDVI